MIRLRHTMLACLVAALALAAGATSASAFWAAGGGGSGSAVTATVNAGNQPSGTTSVTSVTLNWTQINFLLAPLGAYGGGGYTVLRYAASGGSGATPSSACDGVISGAAASLSCVEASVPYGQWRYTVRPKLNSWTGAESAVSGIVSVAPSAPTLGAPNALNPATGVGTGDIQLSWSAMGGGIGYNVYRRTASGSYNFSAPLNGATPLSTASFTDPGSGLTGQTYFYVVRSVANSVESVNSNERSVAAIARPPAPASVTVALAPAAAVNVSWASVGGAAGYNVYRRTAAGTYNFAAPLNGAALVSATTFNDTTAVSGTTYFYIVRAAIIGAGAVQVESVNSPESVAAPADGTVPTGVTLNAVGTPLRGPVTFSGAASDTISGVATWALQYKLTSGSTWTTGCSGATSPYSCVWNTATVADGIYDVRALATDFAGNQATSAAQTSRRIDNTAPTVNLVDTATYLRQTIALSATGSDAGSGLTSLAIQRKLSSTSTWTTICSGATSPQNCNFNTTTVPDGVYDFRALGTDAAGNQGELQRVSKVIDNTAPTVAGIETTNRAGGTVGRPENGDTITYTYSEPINPATLLAGWNGAAVAVNLRFTYNATASDTLTVYNGANNTQVNLGSVAIGDGYVSFLAFLLGQSPRFNGTMVMSGNKVTITLGNVAAGTVSTSNGNRTLIWTGNTAATDLAGNALTAGSVNESGAYDPNF